MSKVNRYAVKRASLLALTAILLAGLSARICFAQDDQEKFTAYESQGVFGYASSSPLLSWAYHLLNVRNFSAALGVVEIIIALLLAIRPISPRLSTLGSLGAIAMFLTTLSFLFTTPGVLQPGYGFPALSGASGAVPIEGHCTVGSGHLDFR